MNEEYITTITAQETGPSWWARTAPVLALVLFAPIITDVLPGTTRITMLFGLLAEIVTYGFAALLIRWLVRANGLSNLALVLLGIAYALAEECIFIQSSLSPILGGSAHVYGRAFGVNWLYLLWALGYECVWSILVPIKLVDLLFPSRKDDRWFGRTGFIVTLCAFVLGALYAWYHWTQEVVPLFSRGPAYQPPLLALLIASVCIALLVIVALRLKSPGSPHRIAGRRVPAPWQMGLLAFLFGLLWYIPLFLDYGLIRDLPFLIPLVGGCMLALLVYLLLRYWSASAAWQDRHSLACISGLLIACMLEGFITLIGASSIDIVGKIGLNVLALVGLFLLARRLRRSIP